MEAVIIFFLAFSLLFYCLFAGADFGAGIIELFRGTKRSEKTQELTNKAIGPVWEANHIWLIILVVILFMAFPPLFRIISVYLHLPLTALLLGIVFRGCFFTFRHYDLIKDESGKVYSNIFAFSSLFSSFFIGITAGALKLGRITTTPEDFYTGFINPWFNFFSFSVGIFTCSLFAFLAAVYLLGEVKEKILPRYFVKQALRANLFIVASGALVFIAAYFDGFPLLQYFLDNPITIFALILATLVLPLLWHAIQRRNVLFSRLLAGFQVFLVLFAWVYIDFPVVIHLKNNTGIGLIESLAPSSTLNALGYALLIGSLFILPAFVYLLVTFKKEQQLK